MKNKFTGFFLGLCLGIIYFIANISVLGFTLSTLWNDFIPKIFPTMPNLSFHQALAVTLVSGLFVNTSSRVITSNGGDVDLPEKIINLLSPFVAYGFALIIGTWLKIYV